MKRMNLQIFEAAKDTGVTQRYQRADYIDVTGGSDSPKYELLGIGVTQLDDSPSAQTTSKRYVNQKSATQSIGGYEWTAPLEFDLIQSEPAIAYISEIGENEKTGVEADTFYVKVCLDKAAERLQPELMKQNAEKLRSRFLNLRITMVKFRDLVTCLARLTG